MAGWRKIDEVSFDFERRRVSVSVEHDARRCLIVKGASEDLLRLSARFEDADGVEWPARRRDAFAAALDDLGTQSFRAPGGPAARLT
jgi:Mg2+-importing ATPase